jgi:ribosome-associated heat shock protein Hsp15
LVYGAGLRLDKWLWFARLAKSRSAAHDLCESRRLRIDGRVIERASALVRPGSVISFPRDEEIIVVRVEGICDRRESYEQARQLYSDLSESLRPASGAMQTSLAGASAASLEGASAASLAGASAAGTGLNAGLSVTGHG